MQVPAAGRVPAGGARVGGLPFTGGRPLLVAMAGTAVAAAGALARLALRRPG